MANGPGDGIRHQIKGVNQGESGVKTRKVAKGEILAALAAFQGNPLLKVLAFFFFWEDCKAANFPSLATFLPGWQSCWQPSSRTRLPHGPGRGRVSGGWGTSPSSNPVVGPVGKQRESHMDEFSTTSDTLDQTDEEILTYTVSDEALEAAGSWNLLPPTQTQYVSPCCFLQDTHPGYC
jgi:hypothetical protein